MKRLTLLDINEASGLKITPNQMAHMHTHLDSLVKETRERIRCMPFDYEHAYLNHTGDLGSVVLSYIVNTAKGVAPIPAFNHSTELNVVKQMRILRTSLGPMVFRPMERVRQNWRTQINPMIATGPGPGTMVVRGQAHPRRDMPLYLEDGADGFQYVYPIFDWTHTQLWAAVLKWKLPMPLEAQ